LRSDKLTPEPGGLRMMLPIDAVAGTLVARARVVEKPITPR
jgi:hypothetical protein